jgi:hypothetical protein
VKSSRQRKLLSKAITENPSVAKNERKNKNWNPIEEGIFAPMYVGTYMLPHSRV